MVEESYNSKRAILTLVLDNYYPARLCSILVMASSHIKENQCYGFCFVLFLFLLLLLLLLLLLFCFFLKNCEVHGKIKVILMMELHGGKVRGMKSSII